MYRIEIVNCISWIVQWLVLFVLGFFIVIFDFGDIIKISILIPSMQVPYSLFTID